MAQPLNAKGRPFSWSYTALADFEGCPARYAASRFYCTVPWVDTEAIIWGNRVHRAAEMTLKNLPHEDPEAYAPVAPYCEALLRSGWFCEAELEIALTRDMKLVKWFAKDAWLRVKIDVVATRYGGKQVKLYDWKSGKLKDDEQQLRLSAAALHTIRPEIREMDGKYIWTKTQQVTGIRPLTAGDIPGVWQGLLPRVARMEKAWETEYFPCKPSPLCGWCQVASCPQRRG